MKGLKEVGATKTGKALYSLPASEIFVEERRIRQVFEKKKHEELMESIKEVGQLAPGICREEGGKIIVVAGECRLRACLDLKRDYEFILTTEKDPVRIKRIELYENIHRQDLTWQEKAQSVAEFHIMEQQLNPPPPGLRQGGQTVEDTSESLNRSPTSVKEDLEIAKFLDVPEVAQAKNRTEAKKVITKIKEDFIRAKALEEAKALGQRRLAAAVEELTEGEGSRPGGSFEAETESEDNEKADLLELINLYLPRVHEGRMEAVLPEFPDNSFDIVLFDPPWGQDLDEVEPERGAKEKFDDSPEVFSKNLEGWLSLLYSKMSEHSHLYMFFGIKDHEFVYSLLEKVGFSVNRMPIYWIKQGAHRVRTPRIWPGRAVEPIAFARKGSKDLQWQGAPDYILTPAPTAAMKGSHMSGKHPDVYLNLIKRSGFPGNKLLDPMAGTCMSAVAAETYRHTLQLDWTMIEEKEEFVRLGINNLVKGYSSIVLRGAAEAKEPTKPFYYCPACKKTGPTSELTTGNGDASRTACPSCKASVVELDKEVPSSFKEIPLDPSDESRATWLLYWKLHPEQQEEMLLWKKGELNG